MLYPHRPEEDAVVSGWELGTFKNGKLHGQGAQRVDLKGSQNLFQGTFKEGEIIEGGYISREIGSDYVQIKQGRFMKAGELVEGRFFAGKKIPESEEAYNCIELTLDGQPKSEETITLGVWFPGLKEVRKFE
ncbi:hypothetical protein FGO68_gene9089 [Halteria grandinella]|uniref:MORN repeat-containing protein n=1 Tax=Halteria grandinella TaxID=5974 RepID=A0A8J8ND05_HALGN|nr:hypothetical protein FGO68_gene9089 [Halteria grandinella]